MTMKCSIGRINGRLARVTLLSGVLAGATILAGDGPATQDREQSHAAHEQTPPSRLVELVRNATKQFVNVNAATSAGYQPFLGCVSGPDHGAMGIHYVNGGLVGD